ncbi:hypothetical protein B0J12DRAFT_737685 [Macrophomina phaseolina]|uniref:Uncharacterized protein n=1 Tax=Macrophomina phaseolina TaxID=35725 RepID=A0ABQ8GLQ7_9PEZI|nr:hypothetical protein B0J12DRAFT_737685 [Macrophomina phaseolina]
MGVACTRPSAALLQWHSEPPPTSCTSPPWGRLSAPVESLGSLDKLYKKIHGLKEHFPQDILKYSAMVYQSYCINGQWHIGGEGSRLDKNKYPNIRPETVEDFLRRTPLELLPETMSIAGNSHQPLS